MEKSYVVYGPQGCGKSTHAKVLAKHFGVNVIIDPADNVKHFRAVDHLYLMQDRPDWAENGVNRRVISFDYACRLAGIEAHA